MIRRLIGTVAREVARNLSLVREIQRLNERIERLTSLLERREQTEVGKGRRVVQYPEFDSDYPQC